MKRMLLLTVAVLGFSVTAYAGEGNGEPFPPPDFSVTTRVQNPKYTMGIDAPFNFFSAGSTTTMQTPKYTMGDAAPFNYYNPGRANTQAPARSSVAGHATVQPHG